MEFLSLGTEFCYSIAIVSVKIWKKIMSTSPRIAVLGAGGRMGRILIQAVKEAGYTLAAAIERPESSLVGADAGELAGIGRNGVKIVGSLSEVLKDCDVVIDFTAPAATEQHLKLCREAGVAIVIGTTGMNDQQKAYLDETATQTPVVYAANYSVGVNVSIKLLELAAKVFGDTVDIRRAVAHLAHVVGADIVLTDVVTPDHQDVGLLVCSLDGG